MRRLAAAAGGGALAVQVIGGRPPADTPFRMDVTGEDGSLALEGGAARGFQARLLSLRLNGEPAGVADNETAGLPAPVVNVARVYAALRSDITNGTSAAPDLGHAVHLSHLIDDIRTAASSGQTVAPTAEWPSPPVSTQQPPRHAGGSHDQLDVPSRRLSHPDR